MTSSITLRVLGPGDAAVLDDVDPDTFDGSVRPRSVEALLAAPDQDLVVALDGTRVVGFASGVRVVEPDKAPVLYVDEIGTADAYRRRGIATALLRTLFERGRAAGCAEAWLLTEADNGSARAFYAALGGTEADRPVYITFCLDPERRAAGDGPPPAAGEPSSPAV